MIELLVPLVVTTYFIVVIIIGELLNNKNK